MFYFNNCIDRFRKDVLFKNSRITSQPAKSLKSNTGGVSFCWIGIQCAVPCSQKYTPPHCFFWEFAGWVISNHRNVKPHISMKQTVFFTPMVSTFQLCISNPLRSPISVLYLLEWRMYTAKTFLQGKLTSRWWIIILCRSWLQHSTCYRVTNNIAITLQNHYFDIKKNKPLSAEPLVKKVAF